LYKLGGGDLQYLLERYFELIEGGTLRYFEAKGGDEKGTVNILGAKVVDRGTYVGKLCFSIEGINLAKGQKEYFLVADDKNEKWKWYQSLQQYSGRYAALFDSGEALAASSISGKSMQLTSTQHANWSRIQRSVVNEKCIANSDSNQKCADCNVGGALSFWGVCVHRLRRRAPVLVLGDRTRGAQQHRKHCRRGQEDAAASDDHRTGLGSEV